MTRVSHDGTVFEVDSDGVDVTWDGHEFRLRRGVLEGATGKEYRDVTTHEVLLMIEADADPASEPVRIGDVI